jgi:hypothetical protein
VLKGYPPNTAYTAGSTVQLWLRAENAAHDSLPLSALVTWRSSNYGVVTVTPSGRADFLGAGDAWIVGALSYGGVVRADSVKVLGVCTAELRVELTPTQATLRIGESMAPSVMYVGCSGFVRHTEPVTWTSDDPSIVSMDATGRIATARAVGTTRLRSVGVQYGGIGPIPVTVTP